MKSNSAAFDRWLERPSIDLRYVPSRLHRTIQDYVHRAWIEHVVDDISPNSIRGPNDGQEC